MWMDADDYLSEDHVGIKVKALTEHPNAEVVKCRGVQVREADLTEVAKLGAEKRVATLFEDVLFGYQGSCNGGLYMVRTGALFAGLKNRKIFETKVGQNFQLLLPVLYGNNIVEIQDEIFFYVLRDESHSHNIHGLEHWKKRQDMIDEVKIKTLEPMYARMTEEYRVKISELLELHSAIMRFEDLLREITYGEDDGQLKYARDITVKWLGRNPKSIQKQIYIWGAAKKGFQMEELLKQLFDVQVSGYIDSNRQEKPGTISPEEINPDDMFIIIPLFYYEQIEKRLDEKNFTGEDVLYPREQLLRRLLE